MSTQGMVRVGCVSARIAPLASARDDSGDLAQLVKFVGYRPNALLTMARRSRLLPAVLQMVEVVLRADGHLAQHIRFLLVCEAARHTGSVYTCAHLAHAAHKAGATWAQISALPQASQSPHFTLKERALIALVCADAEGNDKTWEQARRYWSDDALAEAVAAICLAAWFTRWNQLVQSELEEEPAGVIREVQWLHSLACDLS